MRLTIKTSYLACLLLLLLPTLAGAQSTTSGEQARRDCATVAKAAFAKIAADLPHTDYEKSVVAVIEEYRNCLKRVSDGESVREPSDAPKQETSSQTSPPLIEISPFLTQVQDKTMSITGKKFLLIDFVSYYARLSNQQKQCVTDSKALIARAIYPKDLDDKVLQTLSQIPTLLQERHGAQLTKAATKEDISTLEREIYREFRYWANAVAGFCKIAGLFNGAVTIEGLISSSSLPTDVKTSYVEGIKRIRENIHTAANKYEDIILGLKLDATQNQTVMDINNRDIQSNEAALKSLASQFKVAQSCASRNQAFGSFAGESFNACKPLPLQ